MQLDNNYISNAKLKSGMLFESILASVQLPYWNQQSQNSQDLTIGKKEGTVASSTAIVSDPYIGIFEWLWERDVRKIFTVEIDDLGPAPHSNAAIRQSLRKPMGDGTYRDYEVEIFKWKKYDICSDTILNAAPKAKKVFLYSSGNTAVLRGWACSAGLHKMKNVSFDTSQLLSESVPADNVRNKASKYYNQDIPSSNNFFLNQSGKHC